MRHRVAVQDGFKVGGATLRIKTRGGSVKYQTCHCPYQCKLMFMFGAQNMIITSTRKFCFCFACLSV